jgi:hypothetical protein
MEMKALYGFISTGDKVALYTLRIMYEVPVRTEFGISWIMEEHYIRNLSNDKDKALEKANLLLSDMGLSLKGDPSFDLNEIKRRSSEALESERDALAKKTAEIKAEAEKVFVEACGKNVFLVGKHIGFTPEDVYSKDPSYILWLNGMEIESEILNKFDVNVKIAKDFVVKNDIKGPTFVGEVGEKITLNLTLIKSYALIGYFRSIVFTCKTPENNIVKFFSTAKGFLALEDGDSFSVVGTVKSHNDYSGRKSTSINRPKMAK